MDLYEKAKNLSKVIGDYQKEHGEQITPESIVNWANQFNEEAFFVLNEVAHIMEQTYLSEGKCRVLLKNRLETLLRDLRYSSMYEFIQETHFFDVQQEWKSQRAVLNLVYDILERDYLINYSELQFHPKKNFIYFDDLLASGGTVFNDVSVWLLETNENRANYARVVNDEYRLIVSVFGKHLFGSGLCLWRLMMNTDKQIKNKLKFYCDIEIQDHPRFPNQSYNCMMPLESELTALESGYLMNLDADGQSTRAFRPENTPVIESLFSNSAARNKIERIFIEQGIELFEKVSNLAPNQRPLGMTPPSHRTFGMGTLFFTWRNIPNNAPIVFWWDNNGWQPLFPLKNRGAL